MSSPNDLDAGYRAMAADTAREAEAQEWCEAMTREALADVDAGRVIDHAVLNLPKIPNAETRAAIAEAEAIIAARSARFTSAEDLFRDLDAARKT